MAETTAWRLKFGPASQAALGEPQLIHIFDEPEIFEVPHAPIHCHEVLVWQNDVIPLVDIEACSGKPLSADSGFLAGVVAFQQDSSQPVQFGSIKLVSPPQRIRVSDESVCDPDSDSPLWEKLSLAYFRATDGCVMPVLDLPRLFSAELTHGMAGYDKR